jgi:hypothetical protein
VSTEDVLGIAAHFEKMLYDNAQLARVYLHAWQVTGEPFYRTIVEETLDYVVRWLSCATVTRPTPAPGSRSRGNWIRAADHPIAAAPRSGR